MEPSIRCPSQMWNLNQARFEADPVTLLLEVQGASGRDYHRSYGSRRFGRYARIEFKLTILMCFYFVPRLC